MWVFLSLKERSTHSSLSLSLSLQGEATPARLTVLVYATVCVQDLSISYYKLDQAQCNFYLGQEVCCVDAA